jgi:hypothetical protein
VSPTKHYGIDHLWDLMTTQPPYGSAPLEPPALSDHTIDIPGHGVQSGQWDLRSGITQYLGNLDFRGRRVLEIGTANGFICFEMERRGAEVVAFDLAEDLTYDAPPHNADYLAPESYRNGLRRIRNAWWLPHAALGPKRGSLTVIRIAFQRLSAASMSACSPMSCSIFKIRSAR